jgi:hypothetical protein
MVPPDKLKNALNALQAVLIHARMMAYENAEHKNIAAILDDAHYLPYLIGCGDDKTLELRDYLKEMAEKYHDARFIDKFEGAQPEGW